MSDKISLSIIVPAYNEEENLGVAIKAIQNEISKLSIDYEILIVDDGSTDGTSKIAGKFAKSDNRIHVITHHQNQGFGATFLDGIKNASKTYLTQFHGDNEASSAFLTDFVRYAQSGDVISAYSTNTASRSILRRFISDIFIIFMNLIFRLNLRYYNGAFICKTKILKRIRLTSKGFAIYAEAKVRLFNQGYKIQEIPSHQIGRRSGKSKAVNLRSFYNTVETMMYLIKDVYFQRKLI